MTLTCSAACPPSILACGAPATHHISFYKNQVAGMQNLSMLNNTYAIYFPTSVDYPEKLNAPLCGSCFGQIARLVGIPT
ncbi:MAG: hypothetical protein RLZZ210_334 [Pseudomonadota bacterium]|jgi:hypothetical protein